LLFSFKSLTFKEIVMIKSIRNLFTGLIFLTISQFASAVCYPNTNMIPPGSPPLGLVNGMWCTQNNVQPQFQGIAQPVYIGSGYPAGIPVGSGNQCAGLFERGGRVIGANRGNDPRNTENGGLLGYIVGSLFCPMINGQGGQRIVQQGGQQVNNMNYGGVQQSGVQGVFCNIDGLVTKEDSNATCEARARAKAEGLVSGASAPTIRSQANTPVCASNKSWARLNWPGHPQHDTFACLPGDAPKFPS
jgi:hypothetical protein